MCVRVRGKIEGNDETGEEETTRFSFSCHNRCGTATFSPLINAEHAHTIKLRQFRQNTQQNEGRCVDNEVDRIVLCVKTGQNEARGK